MREVGKRRKSREGRFGSGSALELVPGERSEPGIIPGTWTTVGASTFLADSDDDGVASYLVQGTLVRYHTCERVRKRPVRTVPALIAVKSNPSPFLHSRRKQCVEEDDATSDVLGTGTTVVPGIHLSW